eukprot:5269591-Prymnesium_polylepis.1
MEQLETNLRAARTILAIRHAQAAPHGVTPELEAARARWTERRVASGFGMTTDITPVHASRPGASGRCRGGVVSSSLALNVPGVGRVNGRKQPKRTPTGRARIEAQETS